MITTRPKHGPVRIFAIVAGVVLALAWGVAPASAHHANETVTVTKTDGLADGETVRVTFSGFTPGGKPAKVVIAGQGELVTIPDKLNFDEYGSAPTVEIGPDGTGSVDFQVTADHGTVQDGSTLNCLNQQCWVVVVQEPFLPQPNYDTVPITFAGGTLAPTAAAAPPTTVAPVTTAPPVATTAPATTAAPTTTAPTTTAPTTTTTEAAIDAERASATTEDDGGSSGALFAIIAGVVAVLGVGGYLIARRKPPVG